MKSGDNLKDQPIDFSAYKELLGLPEYVEKQEIIIAATKRIVELFDIDQLFFEDPARSFIMASIAERWGKANTPEELSFLYNAIILLAHSHSSKLESEFIVAASPSIPELSPEEERRIYNRFTNVQLTNDINAQKDVLFKEIRERIGVNPDNEDDFEVVVLDIASESTLFDLPVSISDKLYKDWQNGLLANLQKLKSELRVDSLPVLWAIKKPSSNKKILCLDLPTAERLLHEDIDRAKCGSEDSFEQARLRLKSLVAHEYIHTQGGMSPGMEGYFGIGLEERRAEYLSGDKNGYLDIKRFIFDVEIVTGLDFKQLFDSAPKGGEAFDVYMKIAQIIGLSATLELLMMYPNRLMQAGSNELMDSVCVYLGGYDGFINRLLVSDLGVARNTIIAQRLEEQAEYFRGKEYYLETIKLGGNNVLADRILKILSDGDT